MFKSKLLNYILAVLFLAPSYTSYIYSRDVFLEFKGAYFLATDKCFKEIYKNGGGLYGPEVTFQLTCNNNCWYGFASADFFSKEGRTIGLCEYTKAFIVPVGLGVKYLAPFSYGTYYIGLGFQPTYLKTKNCSQYVANTSHWGFGGIAKLGAFFDLSHCFFLDLFIDYSFVKIGCKKNCANSTNFTTPVKANISGTIFGAGLAYRFN